MSKAIWWIGGIAAVVWLASESDQKPSSLSYLPNSASSATPQVNPGAPRLGGGFASNDDEDNSDEVRQAKQDFEDAAGDLRAAVRALHYQDWDSQLSTIRSRLEEVDDALSTLEGLRPNDPSVQSARDEVDSMRSQMSRLYYENWRNVVPDLNRSSSAIEDEASTVSEDND